MKKHGFYFIVMLLASCAALELGLKIVPGETPTFEIGLKWRKEQTYTKLGDGKWTDRPVAVADKDKVVPNLINGNPVDKNVYDDIVRIVSESGSGCTATIVGPQTIITAAHCAKTGEKVSFTTVKGIKYTATMTRAPLYPGTDHDISLGYVSKPITGISFREVITEHFEKVNTEIMLIGYGCINPGGGQGNDGILRAGRSSIKGASQNLLDLIIYDENGTALCYGDSGGPVLYPVGPNGKVFAINSKGNIKDRSYVTRLTKHPKAEEALSKNFLLSWSEKNGTGICGLNLSCSGDNPTPPPTPPSCDGTQYSGKTSDGLVLWQFLVKPKGCEQ